LFSFYKKRYLKHDVLTNTDPTKETIELKEKAFGDIIITKETLDVKEKVDTVTTKESIDVKEKTFGDEVKKPLSATIKSCSSITSTESSQ